MATFTVKQGKRYRATITLGWLERWAGNETIAERLRAAGFSEVSVSGSGGTRMAEAVWAGPDATGEMPAQVTEVIEICGRVAGHTAVSSRLTRNARCRLVPGRPRGCARNAGQMLTLCSSSPRTTSSSSIRASGAWPSSDKRGLVFLLRRTHLKPQPAKLRPGTEKGVNGTSAARTAFSGMGNARLRALRDAGGQQGDDTWAACFTMRWCSWWSR
jgi:hypothetical protein